MNEEPFFYQALQRPAAERGAFLDAACADDAALRARVEVLLRAHENPGSFLAAPAFEAISAERPIPETTGTVIGPYKLLEQIGEGGFGVVFMAEQTSPVNRKVALKVLKPGMDTREVIGRFEVERQALALMDHPNIAKVFDAGTTGGIPKSEAGNAKPVQIPEPERVNGVEKCVSTLGFDSDFGFRDSALTSGRPYFVMELVKGFPITRYCDEHRLTLRERLELFVPVLQAVQHAHQKGIIHRDLKPSNVLVAEYDGRPVPKVIDFGVAKATGGKLTENTMFTHFGQLVGTLEYMSPEQARFNQLDIDTRTDIYSLGALLYELLTGTTPFGREQLRAAAFDEMMRILRDEEPRMPSKRLSTIDNLAAVAANRHTEPARLSRLMRGELDWIVMKALEKDRNRRYATANGFAMDVQRYLNDEPVQACPPSAWYWLGKFARRNQRVLATLALLGVMLLTSVLALSVSHVRISEALDHETQARQDRERALERERQANEELAQTSYFRSIALAERQLSTGNVGQAEELLNECPPELRGWEWHFLKRQRYGNAPPLPHPDTVMRVVFSPDGRQIASGCLDGSARIWDAVTGRELHTLPGEASLALTLAYSPDGRRLAVGHNDGSIRIWDAASGKALATLRDHEQRVWQVAFSPDGRTLASGSRDRTVRLWDLGAEFEVDADRLIRILSNHPAEVKAVAFGPAGDRVVAACGDGTVKTWNVSGGKVITSFDSGLQFVQYASFSPNARRLAWSCQDGMVKVWATEAEREEFAVQSNTHFGRSVDFGPDGRRIALAGFDGTVRLLDASTGRETLTIYAHPSLVSGVAFSPDGCRLASASYDETVRIWDATPLTDDPLAPHGVTLTEHKQQVYGVAFNSDGRWLASGSLDGTVKVWKLNGGPAAAVPGAIALRYTLHGHRGNGTGVAFSPDGRTIASGGWDGTVILWDLDAQEGGTLRKRGTIRLKEWVISLGFSPDGRLLAIGQPNGIVFYDPVTRKEAHPFKPTMTPVPALEFTPDSQRLISAGASEPVVRVWDVTEDKPIFEIRHDSNPNSAIAVSPDGRFVASPGRGQTVKIWDVDWDARTYAEVRTLTGHEGYVWRVAFCPDGRYLASGSWDSTIKVWDLKAPDSAEPVTLRGHAGFIRSLAFSPDGRRLASASGYAGHGEVKVWDAVLWDGESGER